MKTSIAIASACGSVLCLAFLAASQIDTTTQLTGKISPDCNMRTVHSQETGEVIERSTLDCPPEGFKGFHLKTAQGNYVVELVQSVSPETFPDNSRVTVQLNTSAIDGVLDFGMRKSAEYMEDWPYIVFTSYGATMLDNVPVESMKLAP